MIHGPSTIELRDQAQLELPYGYGFVPQQQAAALMRTMGNLTGGDFIGLVFPQADSAPWFVSSIRRLGLCKGRRCEGWDADELLQSLKDGTEAGNERREAAGIPPHEGDALGRDRPYDATTHRLVWSAEAMLTDMTTPTPASTYNTYALGRDGYISLNLVTSVFDGRCGQASAKELLEPSPTKTESAIRTSTRPTDKVAAYGLAALVAGVAAKKLGLLAVAAAFIRNSRR